MTQSRQLCDARRYEAERARAIPPSDRPEFHLSARVGWMNDPNGFSLYNGRYHLFYQYYPYDTRWDSMHWAHAVSTDLLRWRHLPAAMAPDAPYDGEGCFSGSAVTLPDGRHMLMYTGVSKATDGAGAPRNVQAQCLAFGDGVDYEKYARNPVVTGAHLPQGGSRYDFRDPKLFIEPDGSFRMIAANDHTPGGGRILEFRSDDMARWRYTGVVAQNDGRFGTMWECPDMFDLDGSVVLLVSAQDMLARGFEYHSGNGVFCLVGQRGADGGVEWVRDQAVDHGIDFYAPQTILTPDGRRVMIGWMQNWDTCAVRRDSALWFGQMTLPRELSLRNGRLCQRPLKELERLRGAPVEYRGVVVEDGEIALDGIAGRTIDMALEIEPDGELYNRFAVRFAMGDGRYTSVSFRPRESVVKVDRKFSGIRRDILHQRRARVDHDGGHLRMRVILDRFSVEAFIGDGETVMTATIPTDPSATGIAFFADGRARFNVRAWELKA